MKTILFIALGLNLTCYVTTSVAANSASVKIASEVQSALVSAPLTQEITVIVHLKAQPNLKSFRYLKRADRIKGVVERLQNNAEFSQRNLKAELEFRQGQGLIKKFKSFWIFNGFSVTATPNVIMALANRTDVETIEADEINIVPAAMPPEPNLSLIRVPDIWIQSFNGQGVVIANLDSGVDNTHPDLANRWRGGANSWFDPYAQHATPYDPTGHGTWTMGLMVGGDAGATSIGVAPGAQWIAAKIFKDNGTATATGIHLAFQWLLDPDNNPTTADAPDVVNNSWAYGTPGCNLAFQPDLQALVAAGIVPVFAAGNYGPGSNTSVSPANYPEALSVGATNNLDQLYVGSSKGPSACGEAATIYPKLVAPGVNVSTTDLFGFYTSQTGTSLSAPHVAGSLALLLSAYPQLTVEQQRNALLLSAVDLGVLGPDNSFGYGRLDLAAAYDWIAHNVSNPPPTDTTGPTTTIVNANPNPNNGTLGFDAKTPAVRVTATVSDPVINGLQSSVNAAEVFIDAVSNNGSGIPLLASDGVFNNATEATYANLPLTTIAQLSEGSHILYVHGKDLLGNWGAISNTTLSIDKTPPTISNVNTTSSGTAVNLTAIAVDPALGSIALAEWFENPDPGVGLGQAMSVSGTAITATLNTNTWTSGNHALLVRARDAAGNWSAAVSTSVTVPPANAVFADSFESNNFAAWNNGVVGTRISVNTAANMTTGIYGMQATLGNGTVPSYVTDGTPTLEKSYHARFYFNPHSASPGIGQVTIFAGLNALNTTLFQVQFQRNGSNYQIRGSALRASGTINTGWFNITNNTHTIEIAWQSGTSASFQLYTDAVLKQTLSALNTSAYLLDTVRLGPSAGLVNAASGSLYFDDFASTRNTVIGP
ncbi:MAG: S8 family serine peptidase [Methylococcaceae bacterium]|nr:S8 family serine peptidase [Methylococcaceae bacterium]